MRGKAHVHDIGEILDEHVRYLTAELGWRDCAPVLDGVLAREQQRHRRRVRSGSAYALFLHGFYEARLGIARGRLGKLLLVIELIECQNFALGKLGNGRGIACLVVLVRLAFDRVNARKAVKQRRSAAYAEIVVVSRYFDRHRIVRSVRHLARQKPLVNKIVQHVDIFVYVRLD